jgi:hypothetical protein
VSLFFRAVLINVRGIVDQIYVFICVILELCYFPSGLTVCTFDFFIMTLVWYSLPSGLHVSNV